MRINFIILFFLIIQSIAIAQEDITYVCPPCNSECDALTFEKDGVCPHCRMALIPQDSLSLKAKPKTTIAFYLQSGVEVLDFAGPLEVLTYAGFEIFTVSKTKAPIISQGVLKVIPDYSIADAPHADILAFFGGNGYNTSQDAEVTNWILSQKDVDIHFSVCTGALILAAAGLLDGHSATTFHNAIDNLEDNYPKVNVLRNVRYIDNGKVITTAGISAGIDGALHLVAKLKGYNTARATAYNMEYDNWQPNNGLLINTDNPYADFPSADYMNDFVGTYKHPKEGNFSIAYDDKTYGLIAIVDSLSYPLYHEQDDTFMDVDGDHVTFVRNDQHMIECYRIASMPGKEFAKQD